MSAPISSGSISSFSTLSGALSYTQIQGSSSRCLPPSTVAFQSAGHRYHGVKLIVLKNGTSDPSDSLEGADDYLGPWYTQNKIVVRIRWPGCEPYKYTVTLDPKDKITRGLLGEKIATGVMYFISGNAPHVPIPGQAPRRLMIKDILLLSSTNTDHSFWDVEIAVHSS
ncbi:hypothetical protein AX16_002222 [Volvariella volvacea WC 439]|nr:hypothetical protein AX16_002222 [Volvariella volvacea WC 439]